MKYTAKKIVRRKGSNIRFLLLIMDALFQLEGELLQTQWFLQRYFPPTLFHTFTLPLYQLSIIPDNTTYTQAYKEIFIRAIKDTRLQPLTKPLWVIINGPCELLHLAEMFHSALLGKRNPHNALKCFLKLFNNK